MQSIIKSLMIAILFIALSGCELMGDCTKINIPKNEKQWFFEYKKPREIILKSDLGKFDTLELVDIASNFTPCNKFETGKFQYEECVIQLYSDLMKEKIFFSYYSSKRNVKKGYVGFDNARIDFYDNDINTRATKRYCKYKNDSLIGHVLNYYNADSNDVAIAFWSMELGIIEYETGAGEKFELVDIK